MRKKYAGALYSSNVTIPLLSASTRTKKSSASFCGARVWALCEGVAGCTGAAPSRATERDRETAREA